VREERGEGREREGAPNRGNREGRPSSLLLFTTTTTTTTTTITTTTTPYYNNNSQYGPRVSNNHAMHWRWRWRCGNSGDQEAENSEWCHLIAQYILGHAVAVLRKVRNEGPNITLGLRIGKRIERFIIAPDFHVKMKSSASIRYRTLPCQLCCRQDHHHHWEVTREEADEAEAINNPNSWLA